MTPRQQAIHNGIAAYEGMQQDIIKAVRDHGGRLTQDEFDEEFSERKLRPLHPCGVTGDTFVLSPNGQQQQYLQIAQAMIEIDKLDAVTEDGVVIYKEII